MVPKKFRAWTGKEMVEVTDLTIFRDGSTKVNDDIDSHYNKWPVMQFTGVKDKQDNEIYEGDIIGYWVCYETEQTHTGDNIPGGSYTEPDEPQFAKIKAEVVYDTDRAVFSIHHIGDTPYQIRNAYQSCDDDRLPFSERPFYCIEYIRRVLDPGYQYETVPTSEEYWEALFDAGFSTEEEMVRAIHWFAKIGNIYETHFK
jgi:hypothetical protein